jgi:hypothetical protein
MSHTRKLSFKPSTVQTPSCDLHHQRAAAPSLSVVPLAVIVIALMPAQCDMALIAFPIALE